MLKVGLVGLGFMGSMHLQNYLRLEKEGFPLKVIAIADVDKEKHNGFQTKGNIESAQELIDYSQFNFYSSLEEMAANEELDYVDLCLPTYLHASQTALAMSLGLHVFCEKPMALSKQECGEMIAVAKKYDKQLMIGQTLRFFPSYNYLKELIDTKKYGKVLAASFFRGGTTPIWSWENWLLQKDKAGGALLDQHIHDVDTINWLFGLPKSVSTSGVVVFEGSGYDIVSSTYHYEDGKVISAEDDWTINGDFGFEMRFRVTFEKGALVFENKELTEYPYDGEKFVPTISKEDGYYLELKHFAQCLLDNVSVNSIVSLESATDTIYIAEKEQESADLSGELVQV